MKDERTVVLSFGWVGVASGDAGGVEGGGRTTHEGSGRRARMVTCEMASSARRARRTPNPAALWLN